jgi:imidazolonepropionase-like amidohydrolase
VLIKNVTIFDGTRSIGRSAVRVTDGLIEAVGPDLEEGAEEVIDGEGGVLLPGLLDSHVHVFDGDLETALLFGVTTVLDLFCDPDRLSRYRLDAGKRPDCADIRSAGTGATAPGGHPTQMADAGVYQPFPTVPGPDAAEEFIAQRVTAGSDYIKLFFEDGCCTGGPVPMLDSATATALVNSAHRVGLKTVAHVTTLEGARRAIEAGVDGLAHVFVDEVPGDEFFADVARQKMFVMPTLTPLDWVCGADQRSEYLSQTDSIRYLDAPHRQRLDAMTINEVDPAQRPQPSIDVAVTVLQKLRALGVPLLVGTDGGSLGPQGISVHRELCRLVEAGLTPTEALSSATSVPAEHFGLADRGRVEPGLRADLLLVAGDPTVDIASIRAVRRVWRGGIELQREPAVGATV